MQKLVLEEGERNIEVSLKHENIPQLNTLKQVKIQIKSNFDWIWYYYGGNLY